MRNGPGRQPMEKGPVWGCIRAKTEKKNIPFTLPKAPIHAVNAPFCPLFGRIYTFPLPCYMPAPSLPAAPGGRGVGAPGRRTGFLRRRYIRVRPSAGARHDKAIGVARCGGGSGGERPGGAGGKRRRELFDHGARRNPGVRRVVIGWRACVLLGGYAPEASETSAECTCVKLPGEDFRIVIEQEEDDGED